MLNNQIAQQAIELHARVTVNLPRDPAASGDEVVQIKLDLISDLNVEPGGFDHGTARRKVIQNHPLGSVPDPTMDFPINRNTSVRSAVHFKPLDLTNDNTLALDKTLLTPPNAA
jgi:hypothetical protein